MDKKLCTKCKNNMDLSDFYKDKSSKDGMQSWCKKCTKKYYKDNKSRIKIYKEEYRKNNKEKISEGKNKYYSIDVNAEHKRKHDAKYYEMNRDRILKRMKDNNEYISEYVRNRFRKDLNFKLAHCLRNRTRDAIKDSLKSGSAVSDLGCSIEYLKKYIESQFTSGMDWSNWGNKSGCWSIDHIIPLSKVNLSERKEFLKVANYTNLRPMWHIENIKKGNREDYSDPGVFVKPV